ncbi:MAG: helix-turn-helix transcriptional regulator [Neptuniibacter sp.]
MSDQKLGFGERLKEERERLNMSQSEFAKAAGVSTVSQGYYEQGRRKPSSDYLAELLRLTVDAVYVLTGNRMGSNGNGVVHKEPLDALPIVVNLQEEYGAFNGEQLKTIVNYAFTHQVDEQGIRDFLDTMFVIAEKEKPNNSNN